MITKFDSLYAGHTDLDNIGYGGTPINDRRYSNAHLATALSKAESMATLMDGLGYNCFWMAEHHFQREGTECIPNTILMALHLPHRTKNIKIGCGFNITPMWRPLRLAEYFATADILTGGRIVFGVGRGYHTREVETFGSPLRDQEANRALFEEQVDIIFKALTTSASHTRASTTRCRPRCLIAATPSKSLPSSRDLSICRSSAGNRSRAARCARSSSWPSTVSRAW